ncbi:MAG: hypothetical protein J6J35_04030, partial [Alphaproteobacteria bacterium]|nr:hypothetical protein [Alphaproteobacteria bacterium]
MSDLNIPEFKSSDDFSKWVQSLDEKEIQKWTTDDWLKMYEKVDAYVVSDDYVDKIKKKLLEDMGGKTTLSIGSTTWKFDEELEKRLANSAYRFANVEAREAFAKLYENYRFEPEQLAYIQECGKRDGEKLARRGVDAADLAIESSLTNNTDFIKNMDEMGDIVKEGTSYANRTDISHTTYAIGSGSGYGAKVTFREPGTATVEFARDFGYENDRGIRTGFHEFAHAYAQGGGQLQRELATEGTLAHPELGRNFQKLMEKNKDYYLLCRGKMDSVYNGYHRQPTEKYSEIYGITAERSFRAASGQVSERNALKVSDWLCSEGMGRPTRVTSVDGKIKLEYSIYGNKIAETQDILKYKGLLPPDTSLKESKVSIDEATGKVHVMSPQSVGFEYDKSTFTQETEALEQRLKSKFELDENLAKNLNITTNLSEGTVSIEVPETYSFKQEFDRFYGNYKAKENEELYKPNPSIQEGNVTKQIEAPIVKQAEESAKRFNKRVAEHTAEKAAAKEAERISTVKGLRKQAMDAGEKVLTVAKKGNS